jgi:anti-anti-sigma regulatory factor
LLRITHARTGTTTTLVLEGAILGPWVAEIRASLAAIPRRRKPRIDLAGVTFVDAEGADLLAALRRDGIQIVSPSPFVDELLSLHARNRR